ncbi:MAG: nuclear transport factor 2 family protein [Acidobacteria bacterium]|nr:nuclear transport factor 2 family protein [Acidobacteriota bacterium]
MHRRFVYLLAVGAVLMMTGAPLWAGQPVDPEASAVRRTVEQFLDDLGNRRLDKLPALFAPKATMVVVRQRDGKWTTTHQTSDEWLAGLKAQTPGTIFREPLANVTVHVESGHLAFLRADFTVVVDGKVRSHGVDYFTLVKDGGAWKILNGSYTSMPGEGR